MKNNIYTYISLAVVSLMPRSGRIPAPDLRRRVHLGCRQGAADGAPP